MLLGHLMEFECIAGVIRDGSWCLVALLVQEPMLDNTVGWEMGLNRDAEVGERAQSHCWWGER